MAVVISTPFGGPVISLRKSILLSFLCCGAAFVSDWSLILVDNLSSWRISAVRMVSWGKDTYRDTTLVMPLQTAGAAEEPSVVEGG